MRRILQNKKGSWTDSIYIFFFLIVILFFALIFLKVIRSFNDGINNSEAAIEAKTLISDFTTDVRNKIDNSIILFFFILIIGSWVSSYFLDNSPMYFVIFFVLSFISFFILLPIANVAYSFQFDVSFIDEVQYLPKTFWIINNFAAFLAFYIITTGAVLYAKNKYVQYQNRFQ